MSRILRHGVGWLLLIVSITQVLEAQTVTVDTIILNGNKKTLSKTINFENPIKQGDQIATEEVSKTLEMSRLQLLSSGLFNDIAIESAYNADSTSVALTYEIIENWYLFPAPIFELADRNFNVWWQDFDRDLSRTLYGARLAHYNLTGRRDKLKFLAHTGYQRKLELTYDLPNIIGQNWGLGFNVFYSDQREISYRTEFNKPVFFEANDERRLINDFRAGLRFINRPNTYLDHTFRLEFNTATVDDAIVSLNPDYFFDGSNSLSFFLLEYEFLLDKTDYNLYPSSGYKIMINASKEGIFILNQVDNTFITASAKYYRPLGDRLTVTTQWEGRTNLSRSRQAYSRNRGLGWRDFTIIGYDLFVLDGPDYIGVKNYATFKFFDRTFNTLQIIPRQFRTIPILAYLRFNFDLAYVNEPTYIATNDLNNTLIYGFGPALDIIAYNNYLFAIEYGITQDLDTGIYLKTSISF